jgi:hypothetical protein
MKVNAALLHATPERLLVFGGIALLVVNMLLGEVFAIFVSHVANGEIRVRWAEVVDAARAGQVEGVDEQFTRIEELLERRGRFMNAHSHAGAFGMLAILLALLRPLSRWPDRARTRLAVCLLAGAIMQPLFVFTAPYAGGWTHVLSDLGAVLLLVGIGGMAWGLLPARGAQPANVDLRPLFDSAASRLLLRWGALLILLGMLFGFVYAWVFINRHEPGMFLALEAMLEAAGGQGDAEAAALAGNYRTFNSRIAILAAAHSHAIEMGLIALLLAAAQGVVQFGERLKLFWARVMLVGGYLLPFFIFNATIFGLKSAAFADLSGLLVIVALLAMLCGAVRHTGVADAARGTGN